MSYKIKSSKVCLVKVPCHKLIHQKNGPKLRKKCVTIRLKGVTSEEQVPA